MFFGYRGQGAISNLTDIQKFLSSIASYIQKVNEFGFNNLLYIILLMIIGIVIYKIIKKKKSINDKEKNKILQMIVIPTIFYFIIVSIASPWIELRYIAPVCSLIFIIIMYLLYELLKDIMSEKMSNIIFILVCASILISPIVCKIEPEVMYSDKKEIVHKLEEELNVPTIYIFNSENNRFLDDILLFSKINESYIAKDIEITEDNVKDILKGKDMSNGVVVFINEGQNNDEIIDTIKKATELKESKYLKRLNACDIYTISASQETK